MCILVPVYPLLFVSFEQLEASAKASLAVTYIAGLLIRKEMFKQLISGSFEKFMHPFQTWETMQNDGYFCIRSLTSPSNYEHYS